MSTRPTAPLRDNSWLEARVDQLWETYYADVTRVYPIKATFGPRARYRYGSIYSVGRQCHILINRLFAHPDVPEYVTDATLVHELAHYVHGYGSGRPKLYAHPHRGGVVEKELAKRGCLWLEETASVWRRENWQAFYVSQTPELTARRVEREKREETAWQMYLSSPGFRNEEVLCRRLEVLAPRFGHATLPFEVGWLLASPRRNGLSYYFDRESRVRLHGTLADSAVPSEVIDYELGYWLAVFATGNKWRDIENAMRAADTWPRAEKAIQWRRKVWPNYHVHNHPLKAK
jgi:hypothetical protein